MESWGGESQNNSSHSQSLNIKRVSVSSKSGDPGEGPIRISKLLFGHRPLHPPNIHSPFLSPKTTATPCLPFQLVSYYNSFLFTLVGSQVLCYNNQTAGVASTLGVKHKLRSNHDCFAPLVIVY
ncbi:hypothetical protein V6N13_053207 [Hibiscus sabdariffa]|uniref:Uncharacterized protein n=2 Tax=Hibiscus sabdariffa TaxID=183260 RepID=A0ABR2Q6K8_9ROSI